MRRHRPHLLLVALCCVCPCRGWTPAALNRVLSGRSTAGASAVTCSRTGWSGAGGARCGSAPRHTTTTAVAATSARDPWGRGGPEGLGDPEGLGGPAGLGGPEDPEDETQAKKPLPRVKMDDTPIPDYLIDMLKESGEIDENGKPLNDFFDPDDDDTFGSKRMKEHNAEVETDYYDVPFGEMLFGGKDEDKEDTGSLMDTSINSAVIEYGFPAEFFLDMLCRWGVPPPINQDGRLGDLIDAEQAAGLCEALTGLDGSDVRDNYLDESLEDLAYELEIPLPDLFQACAVQKINLPLGGDTHITVDEYKLLLDSVVEDGEKSRVRQLFDDSRKSHRWSGQKDSETRDLAREESDWVVEKNNAGFGWRDGPPTLGDGEGELPLGMAHISGRIFGEDIFASVSGEEEGEEEEGAFAFDLDAEEGGA